MSIPFGHHQLHNRYRFEGKLELITALKVSSGVASNNTDAPFMRDFSERPFIPGSSLRGAIRSEVERMIAAVGETVSGLRACTSFEKDCCAEKIRKHQLQMEEEDRVDEQETRDKLLANFMEKKICDVCKLFGTSGYASRLVFEDSYPEDTLKTKANIRDGVGIDRDTGAAREGAKFDYEVVEQDGAIFLFSMQVENFDNTGKDRKLVELILGLLKNGIHVGGKRSGGLGLIRLQPDFEVTAFENPQALWDAISKKNDIYTKIEWKEADNAQT